MKFYVIQKYTNTSKEWVYKKGYARPWDEERIFPQNGYDTEKAAKGVLTKLIAFNNSCLCEGETMGCEYRIEKK